ncbi:RNA-binding protein 43 [Enoplosus armatus]|uniref:RNA-binding protein 43 n=1 Tax=Enoplosus armatus TaxID=215367 RepID=UPI0039922ECE
MDVPVEATVHLNVFPNKTEVREILRSNGFVCTDLSSDRVRVKGSFLKLKTVAASLESLLKSQTKTDIAPYSSSPAPMVSSGAISKYYANNSSDGNRSRSGSRNKPLRAFPSSHPLSPEYRDSSSPRPDQHCSVRPGKESFVVDADVFMYADRLRKKDINCILDSHNVKMDVCQVGDGFNVTLLGKSASTAVGKIQSLLNDLNKSLRTQEVPLKDMNYEGKALLERIQKKKNIYDLVLIRAMNDTLHLIGPSGESYKLKQSLLGNPVDQSGRTGRTFNKNSRARSSSLPPVRRKDTETDGGAVAYPSPVGAAGYSPSKYQDDKQKGAVPERGAPGGSLRRSLSGSRGKTHAGRANGVKRELENKPPTPKSPLKSLQEFLKIEDLKKKFKPWR